MRKPTAASSDYRVADTLRMRRRGELAQVARGHGQRGVAAFFVCIEFGQ